MFLLTVLVACVCGELCCFDAIKASGLNRLLQFDLFFFFYPHYHAFTKKLGKSGDIPNSGKAATYCATER
jgi:hypothetical protein